MIPGKAGKVQQNVGGSGYPVNMEPHTNHAALIALSLAPGFSWSKTRAQIEEFGTPSEVLRARFGDQLFDDGYDQAIATAVDFVATCEANGVRVASLWGEDYPKHLRTVHDAPPILFWQGRFDARDEDAVAIVGTRNPDHAGTEFAHDLATTLALNGIPVVSGLARGIDGVALRTALSAHGRTVGVIGTGHDRAYPPEHAGLQREVAEHLLISQFKPGTAISKRNFPMRNVVMSGFASLTMIVQAGETSGTRIQARAAVKHGRPLVISSSVYQNADWAKQLVSDHYDVTVVRNADDAYDAVIEIHARRRELVEGWNSGAQLVG